MIYNSHSTEWKSKKCRAFQEVRAASFFLHVLSMQTSFFGSIDKSLNFPKHLFHVTLNAPFMKSTFVDVTQRFL